VALRALQHELHNALTPLGALAQTARAHPHDEHVRGLALRKAAESPQAISELCSQLLRVFLEAPEPAAASDGTVDLRDVIGRVVAIRRELQPEVAFVARLGGRSVVEADEATVSMVLTNVLINAEAAIHGHGEIRIATRSTWNTDDEALDLEPEQDHSELSDAAESDRGPWIAISVVDSGTGISPERLAAAQRTLSGGHEPNRATHSLDSQTSYNYFGGVPGMEPVSEVGGRPRRAAQVDARGRGQVVVGGPPAGRSGARVGVAPDGGAARFEKPSGLGLSIVRRLVASVGGRVRMRGGAGGGVCVTVWFRAA
jgi:signal transduction histidine kinase